MSAFKISKRALNTPASPIRRLSPLAAKAKSKGIKVFGLNIGQPDIPTPQEFFEGIHKFSDPVLAYETSEGNARLRSLWAQSLTSSLDRTIDPNQILITTGASEALIFLFMIICDPGDEVLIFDPTYANYIGFAAVSGVSLVPILTSLDNNFSLPTADQIIEKITNKTKAILLCNPNNPTGTVYTRAELKMLTKIAEEKNLCLVVDETYREFVYDGIKPVSILEVAGKNPHVVVVDSFSKRFSLCGARIGGIISDNQDFLAQALNIAQARLSVGTIEQFATAHMIEKIKPDYLESVRLEYENRRNVLFEGISSIDGVVAHKPHGAFYMVVKLPVDNTEKFASYMLSEFSHNGSTTFVAPAGGFYMSNFAGTNKIRIAYVLNTDDIKAAVLNLKLGIESYNKGKR